MSEIKKYKKYLNFKANPRYLRRDFIVPLYTGTEPDIVPEASVEEQGMVVDPSRILPKNFTDDMPFVTDENNPEQLELADGGSVERQGFAPGGDVKNTFYNLKKKLKRNPTVTEVSKQIFKNFDDLSYKEKKPMYDKVFHTGKKENLNFYKTSGNPTYQFSKQIGDVDFPVASKTEIKWPNKKIKDKYEQQIINRFKYARSSADLKKQRKLGNLLTNKQLAKNFNISERIVERLNTNIIEEYNLKKTQPIIGKEEVQKTREIKRREAQLKFSDPYFEQKVQGTYKAHLGHMGDLYNRIVTAKNLGYTPAEINDAMKTTLDPILKNISQAQDKLIKNKPSGWKKQLRIYNQKGINYSSLAEGYKSFDIIDPNTLKKYTYGVDYLKTIDPAALYEGKPIKEIAELTDKREINKIQKAFDDLTEAKKIARTEGLEQADISKIKNSELLTEENLRKLQTFKAFEENRKAVLKAQSKIPVSETFKTQMITKISKIKELTQKLDENPELVKAFYKGAGLVCRRTMGGKIDNECLAENIVKEVEKLETGTDLQKASAINKFKKAGKLAAQTGDNAYDIIVGLGAGTAGKVFGSLASLSAGLSEASKGSYKEAARDIGRFLTPFSSEDTYGTYLDDVISNAKEEGKNIEPLLNFKNLINYKKEIKNLDQQIENLKTSPQTQDPLAGDTGVYSDPNKFLDELMTKRKNLSQQYSETRKNITPEAIAKVKNEYLLKTGKDYTSRFFPSILGQVGPNEKDIVYNIAENRFIDDYSKLLSDEKAGEYKATKFIEGVDYDRTEEDIDATYESGARGGAAEGGYIDYLRDYNRYARGGRIHLSEGGKGPKLSRRGFLGFLMGAASLPFVGKLMKGKKGIQAAKVATKVLPKVADMPEWFNPLVTRIMNEGIDISPKAERVEDIVKVKKLEVPVPGEKKPDIITMREYPDGKIEIEADVYGGSFDTPFSLEYRPPKIDMNVETGQPVKYPGEFSVIENRPRPVYSPHDADYEIDYENMSVKDAISDLERIEKIATGKRIHPKRVAQRQKARADVEDRPYEDIINRYGDAGDNPDWWDPDNYD